MINLIHNCSMNNVVFLLGIFIAMLGLIQTASGLTLGMSSEKILETQQLILLGTVDSVEARSGDTEYAITVLEYVKTPSGFNKVDTLHVVGCGEGQIGGCITFDEGQDVLFILNERNNTLLVSELSFVSPNPNCTMNDIFRYNDEKYDGLSVHQGSKNNRYLYTNQPITAQYYYFNKDLDATSVDVTITVVDDFPDILKEETIRLDLDECQPNAKAEMEFVIDSPGSFAISAKVEGNGGGESFSGVKVIDYVVSPLKQFKSGIPLDKIQCKEGLELVFKSHDSSPVCVKSETKQRLIERGWTASKGHVLSNSVQNLPKFEITGLNYANHPDEPLIISVEKIGYSMCDSWDAKIVDVSDNSVVWERDSSNSCVVLDPPKQQKFEYKISNENRPIVVSKVGNYVFQIAIGGTYLEQEFVVRNNFSGKSLDRLVYPTIFVSSPDHDPNPSSIILQIGVNNTTYWKNESNVPITLISEDKRWSTGLIPPNEGKVIQFNETAFYKYHSLSSTILDGRIAILSDQTESLPIWEKLAIAREIIKVDMGPPITAIGIGNADNVLAITIHEDELEKNPNAEEYYKKRYQNMIPFEVPIRIKFGHIEPQ